MSSPNATVIGRIAVKVVPNTDDFRRDAKRELDAIERSLQDIDIQFTADVRQAVNETRDAVKQAQRSVDDIDLGLDIPRATKARVGAELALLSRDRVVNIVPRVEKAAAAKVAGTLGALSGARALGDAANGVAEWVGELDKAIPRAAGLALGITNLSSSLLAGTSNLLAFSSSLASTAGAALALPGIFGGFAFGAAATFAVLKDFNRVLPEVGKKFTDLQDRMSGRFWDVAEEPFRQFINSIFPEFARGMERTSGALGGFFANLTDSARNVFGNELRGMFADLSESIRIAGKSTDAYVGILEKLGSVGAGNLPRLAGWFGDIAESFDTWLARKGTAGLQAFVDTGIDALQDLGGVISATGRLLAGLASAAERAGGGSLAALRAAMEGAADAVSSSRFQRNLTATFEGAHIAMDRLTYRSGPAFRGFMVRLSRTLRQTLPTAGETGGKALAAIFDALDRPKVEKSIVGAFRNLDKAVDELAPTLPGVAKALAGMLDVLGDLTVNVARGAAPALDALAPTLEKLSGDLEPLIKQLGDLLVNAVQIAAPVVEDFGTTLGSLSGVVAEVLAPVNGLLDALGKLPAPVLSTASALTSAVVSFAAIKFALAGATTQVTKLATGLGKATLKAKLLSDTARSAAGVGGMLLLQQGAENAGTKLGALETTLGGLAAGFAVGGPWGAAVGGIAGGLKAWNDAIEQGRQNVRDAIKFNEDYASSLDQTTAALTKQTKAIIYANLQNGGGLDVSRMIGIPDRDMVNAAAGNVKALERITERVNGLIATRKNGYEGFFSRSAASDFISGLKYQNKLLTEEQQTLLKQIDATKSWKEALKGVPRDVVARLRAVGFDPTLKVLRQISREGKGLTDRQLEVILKATGSKVTIDQIRGVSNEVKTGMDRANREAKNGVDRLVQELTSGTRQAKPDFQPFSSAIPGALSAAKSAASEGGRSVGANLKAGMEGGFFGVITSMASTAAAAIRAAIAAARAEAQIKSPSRKMMKVGDYMGQGLVLGLARQTANAKEAGSKMAKAVFEKNFAKALQKAVNQADNIFSNLLSKVGKKGAGAVRKQFADDLKGLKTLAKQHERLMRQYDKAVDKLQSVKQKMAAFQREVRQTVIEFANPVDIGDNYAGIVSSMQDAAKQAQDFQKVIKQLIKQGLNKTTLKQILAAGPETGLATAQAILDGGVQQINKIQKQINDAAKGVGKASGQELFGGLLDEAQSDVNKLVRKLAPLQKQLRKFAKDLVDALRDELNKQFAKAKTESTKKVPTTATSAPKSATGSAAKAAKSVVGAGPTTVVNLTYVSNAPSLSSEEALFAAAKRGRMAFAH